MKFYLIRHGQTTANAGGRHQGWLPIPLTDKGMAQAKAAGERLKGIPFCRYLCSDLLRTRQTAELVFPEIYKSGRMIFDEDIRELDTGALNPFPIPEIERRFGKAYEIRRPLLDVGIFGAEDVVHFRARVNRFLDRMAEMAKTGSEDDKVAVVTHGGVLRAIMATLSGIPDDHPFNEFPCVFDNCSVSVIEYTGGRWWIRRMNVTDTL